MAVTLESLKFILKENPKISFDGFTIDSVSRMNIVPPYFSTENPDHASTVVSKDGMILMLRLSRSEKPTDPIIINEILTMPNDLILSVKLANEGGVAMVRKLSVEQSTSTSMQPTIKLKLHTNNLGLPSLYFDQIEALKGLNANNEDQWIASQLKECVYHSDIVRKILKPRSELGLTEPLYQLANGITCTNASQSMLVPKDKLKKLFPYLPVDDEEALSLLTRAQEDKISGLKYFDFALKIEDVFSIYGGMNRGLDYTACLKQMLQK